MRSIHFGFMKILILFSITFLITTSCDVNDPKKDNPKPEGYQEDIPWPSLADSPWPMYQHDPQNTGRSKLEFLVQLTSIENSIYCNNLLAGCVLTNNTILFNNSNPAHLYNYDQSSMLKIWEKSLGSESLTAPIIAKDKIYTTSQNKVYAFTTMGDTLWSLSFNTDYIYQSTMNIDKEGNIYLVTNRTLFKINSSGKIINQLLDGDIENSFNTTAFSPDGKTLYLQGSNSSIIAIDVNSFTVKWKYGTSKIFIPPIIDARGNIYLILSIEKNLYLASLTNEGNLRWKLKHSENIEAGSYPAISKYGDIIFGFDTLYSVSFKGELNWKKSISTNNPSHFASISSITTDNLGNLLVGTYDNKIRLLDKKGDVKKEFQLSSFGKGLFPIIYNGSKIIAPIYKGEKIFVLN